MLRSDDTDAPFGLPLALWRLDRLSCCRTLFAAERLSPSARERVQLLHPWQERREVLELGLAPVAARNDVIDRVPGDGEYDSGIRQYSYRCPATCDTLALSRSGMRFSAMIPGRDVAVLHHLGE